MMKPFLAFFLSVVIFTGVSAQTAKNISSAASAEDAGFSSRRLQRIDAAIAEFVAKGQTPGAVAMIVRDGKVVYHKAFGYSDADRKTNLKKDDIFRIASQSKAITSLAVMMLWEEGRFLLDDPVSAYIPEFGSPRVLVSLNGADTSFTAEPARNEITIRHLLTHTSGIDYAVIGSADFKAIYDKHGIPSGIGNHRDLLADKMKILATLPLKHQPGERWTYGLNHDVLGYLVEIWSGMSFDAFLRTRIFEPMGMKDTYFYLPKEKHSRLVALHQFREGKPATMKAAPFDAMDPDFPKLPGTYHSGGAGLSSTAEDYAKFLQLFLNKGEYNGVRLLGRKTVELMMTEQFPALNINYGLAFGLETEKNDHSSVYTVGSFSWGGAFSTTYWADPKERMIGLLYTNVYGNPYGQLREKFKVLVYQAIND